MCIRKICRHLVTAVLNDNFVFIKHETVFCVIVQFGHYFENNFMTLIRSGHCIAVMVIHVVASGKPKAESLVVPVCFGNRMWIVFGE